MTIKELAKYNKIKFEIKQLQEDIKDLENISIGSVPITDMPKGIGDIGSAVEGLIEKKEKLEIKLTKKLQKLVAEHTKIENYLDTIEDNNIRIIIRAKYLDGKSWNQIGKELNFERTTPYYHLKKYLRSRHEEVQK